MDKPEPAPHELTARISELEERLREAEAVIAALRSGAADAIIGDHDVLRVVSAADQEHMERLATTDALTGLLNRRHFFERFSETVHAARRYGFPVAMCMADVDRLKRVNDRYGHQAGDTVLQSFAGLLKDVLRSEDFAGRYGGDEFAVVFPHTGVDGAQAAIDRVRESLAGAVLGAPPGTREALSASFGIAELCDTDASELYLLGRADEALLQAKSSGRAKVVVAAADPPDLGRPTKDTGSTRPRVNS